MNAITDAGLEDEIREIALRCDCELRQLTFGGGVLRLVLDRPNGVKLEHCERVSRDVSALLDVSDFDPGRYTLEVTSPGLDRELFDQRDYERFVGETVKVTWRDPSTGMKRTDDGRILAVAAPRDGTETVVKLEIGRTIHELRLADISKARLVPHF